MKDVDARKLWKKLCKASPRDRVETMRKLSLADAAQVYGEAMCQSLREHGNDEARKKK